jgi:HEPN domain-containing protein
LDYKKYVTHLLNQAENDLQCARMSVKEGFFSQTCFISQQAAEKAIKAYGYFIEMDIRGHSIAKIARSLGINGHIEQAGKQLDLYYISSRYPDALAEGAPFEFFSVNQAKEALEAAELIYEKMCHELSRP